MPALEMEDTRANGFNSSPAHSPGRDLSSQLLEAGWRKFFSKREQRPYFFNKFTNQSLWDEPTLGSPGPSRHDPLGIATPSPSSVMSPQECAPRRRHSSLDSNSQVPTKKASLLISSSWNLTIPTNVIMYERAMSDVYPPHPMVEQSRAKSLRKLRQQYEEACMTREGIHAPLESFNRWLLERKVADRAAGLTSDPILSSDCENPVSPSMCREILNDIPVKLVKPKYVSDARRQLTKYAEGAKKIIESRNVTPESRKIVKWNVEDSFAWVRRQMNASYDDYMERLAHLKRQCQPHIKEAASAGTESICRKMYNLAKDDTRKLSEMSASIWKENGIEEVISPVLVTERKVFCYPRILGTPSPRLPTISVSSSSDAISLTYNEESLSMNMQYFYKLECLYRLNCKDDPRNEHFLARVWCLLRRYQTYFGVHKNEGAALQAALPATVFECLSRIFGVTFECFASPLNCYYKQYCSAFSDTDGYFGSRGPLLDFHPIAGSFEANPPFSEELMESMVNHFENLLENSSEALSFVVCLPEWRDPPTKALIRLESSRFKRKEFVVPALEHQYRNGFQHICSKDELHIHSSHGTLLVFLQNEKGFEKWTPNSERLSELAISFQVSKTK
ncbi:mRNA (2'-O-methyladenosine-N(6)-)-methyltransferase-like [Watersipora subatra]|uniref:mRNA (2'-O-methyladenosine-N(6)-)-methyltransferase-like n=1 Tax=Watersipora subatra TaxID=2589382 RepID=UPI00355C413A